MMDYYHLLPQFRPARLQDLVLWYEPWSFRGRTWRNLAPYFSDRNHGTAYGVGLSTWHPLFAPAALFDGVDAHVKMPNNDSLNFGTGSGTIECWTYVISDVGNYDMVLHKGGSSVSDSGYDMEWGVDPWIFSISDGSARQIVSLSGNPRQEWLHVAMVIDRDSQLLKVCYNRVLQKQSDISGVGNIDSSKDLVISKPSYLFHGIIAVFRIYKVALTPAEIVHNYTHHPLYYLQRGIDPSQFVKEGGIYYVM